MLAEGRSAVLSIHAEHSYEGAKSEGSGSEGSGGEGVSDHFQGNTIDGAGTGGSAASTGGDAISADQDQAREAVARGLARPLQDVLAMVGATVRGDILDVHLKRAANGRAWTYSFVILTPEHHYMDVQVDAVHNTILKIRQR